MAKTLTRRVECVILVFKAAVIIGWINHPINKVIGCLLPDPF
jgi:hypothetical protein